MALDQAKVLEQFDALIAEHAALQQRSKHDDLSDLGDDTMAAIASRLRAAIARLAPGGSSYVHQAELADPLLVHLRIPEYAGIVKALRADYAAGWLETIEELIHAATFADLLEQADELLGKGYKDAAAVIIGSSLEAHLRQLCDKFGISTVDGKGAPKKADTMRTELATAQVFNKLVSNQVLSWLHLRNAAAHGNYAEYDKAAVEAMLRDLRSFLTSFPA